MIQRLHAKTRGASVFTEKMLMQVADDLESGRMPVARTMLSDDFETGLRAHISKTGTITFIAHYPFGPKGERPMFTLGQLDKSSPDHISLAEARQLTKTIKALAEKGIDPKAGLHRRLVKELLKEGVNWKPSKQ